MEKLIFCFLLESE